MVELDQDDSFAVNNTNNNATVSGETSSYNLHNGAEQSRITSKSKKRSSNDLSLIMEGVKSIFINTLNFLQSKTLGGSHNRN